MSSQKKGGNKMNVLRAKVSLLVTVLILAVTTIVSYAFADAGNSQFPQLSNSATPKLTRSPANVEVNLSPDGTARRGVTLRNQSNLFDISIQSATAGDPAPGPTGRSLGLKLKNRTISQSLKILINTGLETENRPPVAHAGPDQTVAVGSLVTLNGSQSTDPDGDPLTFSWSFLSIPPDSNASLLNPTSVTPTFIADQSGDYVVELVVHDGLASSNPDIVTISTINSRPVANAGPDQTIPVGSVVILDGSDSTDADGDILTFDWSFVSTPEGSDAVLLNPFSINPSFLVTVPGDYVVRLIVNDGQSDSDPDIVTISTENTAPVANAGPDQTVLLSQTVHLDGSHSSDADGDPLTYNWSFILRPEGSSASLSNSTSVNPTFVTDIPGVYVVQLIVNDGTVDSSPDTVTISTENSPPIANAGPDQTIAVGSLVQLDGSGSTDVDGDPLSFTWSFVSRPAGSSAMLSDVHAVDPSFVADTAGTYVVQLIVSDDFLSSTPDTVIITTENTPPVANAGPDQTIPVGSTVVLDGTASFDADGDPLNYNWTFASRPADSTAVLMNASSPAPHFTADVAGSYVVQLVVNDGIVNSSPDTVTISTDNSRPVAEAGMNQIVALGETVQLDGSGSSDADGDSLTYSWSLTSRPPGSEAVLSNATAVNPTFVADLPGVYVAQLIVNDGQLDSLPDTVTISTTGPGSTLGCGVLISDEITAAAQVNQYTFQGNQGQTITLTLASTGGFTSFLSNQSALLTLFAPSGASVGSLTSNNQGNFVLPETGTYVVLVNARNFSTTGSYSIGLECLFPAQSPDTVNLECGSLSAGTISSAAQVDLYRFNGAAGQTITLTLASTGGFTSFLSNQSARLTLFAPSGVSVGSLTSNNQGNFVLPETGTYVVLANARNFSTTGSYNIGLECLFI